MLKRLLKLFGWAAGCWLIAIGLSRMALSVHTVPGAGRVSATVDSETRVAGALFVGFGVAYIWAFWRRRIPVQTLWLLSFTMALIGVARLNSMAGTGLPHLAVALTTVVDFTAAALTYWYATLGDKPDAADDSERGHR